MAKSKIRVRLRSFDSKLIDQSAESIVNSVKRTGANICGPVPLPTRIRKYTVLRSPHVNKKSREQFEMRVHKRLIDISEPSKDTIEALEKLELPAGVEVDLKIG
jgi:small subunit ribosomal protein S10